MRRAAGGEAAHAAIWCEPEGPGDYDVIEALWLPSQERGASSLRSLNRSLRGGTTATPPWDAVLALPGTHLHLYGKLQPKAGRKMGHLNITGASAEAVRAVALRAAAILGIEPF